MLTSASWSMKPHDHAHYEAVLVRGGELEVVMKDRTVTADTGDVLLYPPHTLHSESAIRKTDMLFFSFTGESIDEPLKVRDSEGRMRVLAEWMLREQSSGYLHRQRVLDALVVTFTEEFVKAAAPRPDPMVERVRAYMRKHLKKTVKVEDLAKHANMSRAHFIRTFRKAAGRPPMEDLRMLRVETARDRIMTTDLPLKAIAPEVGFRDEYHMSKVFRKMLGMPPGYFRRALG